MGRIRFVSAVAGLVALVAVTGAAMCASRDDTIGTEKGPVGVHAIHHASLWLTWQGKEVLVDPAAMGDEHAEQAFAAVPRPDLIIYTHNHPDHFDAAILQAVIGPKTEILAPQEVADEVPAALKSRVHVMANGDKANVDGIGIEAVAMYNTTPERMKFHPKGKGNGYILTFDGKRVYVAGDTEEAPELAHLSNIEAAFLPMNLPYTETVEAAAKWVRDFKPRVVFPYHFRNGDGSKSDLNTFKVDVGGASQVRVLDWY